jgi:hypothetical protein
MRFYLNQQLGTVVHTCHPKICGRLRVWETKIGRIAVTGQQRKKKKERKVNKTSTTTKAGHSGDGALSVIPATSEAYIRRSWPSLLEQKHETLSQKEQP